MRNFALGLLECSAMASIVMLAVVLIRTILGRRLAPVVLLTMWALALARLLLPVALPSPVHLDALLPRPAAMALLPTANTVPVSPAPVIDAVASPGNIAWTAHQPLAALPASTVPSAQLRWWNYLDPWVGGVTVWAAGTGTALLLALLRGRRLRRAVRLCQPVCDTAILAQVDALRAQLGIRTSVRMLRCAFAATPMVYGVRRPVLLLPPEYLTPDANALQGVLLHELSHIRRQDILWERLWLLARAAHWFNPLVYLACRLRRDDVELACDMLALRQMDAPARLGYGEALLQAARGQSSRRLRSAAALLGSSGIGRRLRALAAPPKNSRLVAALCGVLAVVLVVGCFTTACQPTPAKPAVVNKNDGKLEEKLKETASPAAINANTDANPSASPDKVTLRSRMNIPETWQYAKASDDSAIKVQIDATVEVPDVAQAAVYRAEMGSFTVKQIEKMDHVLLDGAEFYEPRSPSPDYWQEQILLDQQEIANAKKGGNKDYQRKMENELAYSKKEYAKALKADKPHLLKTLAFQADGSGVQMIQASMTVNGRNMAMMAANSSYMSQVQLGLADDSGRCPQWFGQIPGNQPEGVQMTAEQALEQAKNWMAQIAPDLHCVSVTPGCDSSADQHCIWLVTFANAYGGMPSNDYAHSIDESNATNDISDYEKIVVGLDDTGFANLRWQAPLTTIETVNADAVLMSFPQMQDTIVQALYRNAQGSAYNPKVTRVVLGLTRIAYKDHPGEYLLVPSWDIYGLPLIAASTSAEKKQYDKAIRLLLTVNAVDGSIIDTSKGY